MTRAETRPLRLFWLLAFGITWGAGALGLLLGSIYPAAAFSSSSPLYFVAGWGPTLAALIVTWHGTGLVGCSDLLSRALPTRAGLKWYCLALIGYPVALFLVGRFVTPLHATPSASFLQLLPVLAVTMLRDTGPLGEEFGWRGLALPALLHRFPPIAASVLLGVAWGAWHLPAFLVPTLSQAHLSLPLFLLGTVALSIIMTWLYLRTGGDLLLMILVHLVTNFAVSASLISFANQVVGEAVIAGLVLVSGGLQATGEAPRVPKRP